MSTVTIYRHFLKALRHYPSVKQPQYIIACREGERDPCSQRQGSGSGSCQRVCQPAPAPAQPQPSPSPAQPSPAQSNLAACSQHLTRHAVPPRARALCGLGALRRVPRERQAHRPGRYRTPARAGADGARAAEEVRRHEQQQPRSHARSISACTWQQAARVGCARLSVVAGCVAS